MPTSTIQILVFSVVGAGLAAGIGVHWSTISTLAVIWGTAPVVAGLLGYILTRALDLVPAIRAQAQVTGAVLAGVGAGNSPARPGGTSATSMNQALNRPRQRPVRVLRGWLIGPAAAIALSYAISWLVAVTTGAHTVQAVG